MLRILTLAAAIALGLTGAASAQNYPWKPTKPITIIVPWGAGGSTDQVVRLLAKEIEGALGQSVVIVNQPGASGSIGTKAVLEAPKDGYTWASGAAKDAGTYAVTGLLNTKLDAQQLRYANLIRQSGDSLSGLLHRMLDFSQTEGSPVEPDAEPDPRKDASPPSST